LSAFGGWDAGRFFVSVVFSILLISTINAESAFEPNSANISLNTSSHFWQNTPVHTFSVKGTARWQNLTMVAEPVIVSEPYGQDILGVNYTRTGVSGRFTNAFVRYTNDLLTFQLGRAPVHWGSLISSHSNNPFPISHFPYSMPFPAYDHFDMQFKFGQFQLEMLAGQLGSEKLNGIRILRNIAGHRLTWLSKNKKLMAGLGEMIIYTGENRGFEWQYMNPAIPYVFSALESNVESSLGGDNDNSIIFATMRYVLKSNISVYGEFIIDDFQVDDNNLQNGLGYKIGIDGAIEVGERSVTYEMEWTRINSWTYIHHGEFTNWFNRGHALGYPYGPDLRSLHLQADMQINNTLYVNVETDWIEKGSNTLSSEWGNNENKDDPFPNPPVTRHVLFVTSLKWFWQYGSIETGWSNYNFPNKIAYSDPTSKTKGGLFLTAQFFYTFGFKL